MKTRLHSTLVILLQILKWWNLYLYFKKCICYYLFVFIYSSRSTKAGGEANATGNLDCFRIITLNFDKVMLFKIKRFLTQASIDSTKYFLLINYEYLGYTLRHTYQPTLPVCDFYSEKQWLRDFDAFLTCKF